jgi:hypothetical protein
MLPPESNKWPEELPKVNPPDVRKKEKRTFRKRGGYIKSGFVENDSDECGHCGFIRKAHDPQTKQCPVES